MKRISEVIAQLEAIKAEHGDIAFVRQEHGDFARGITPAYYDAEDFEVKQLEHGYSRHTGTFCDNEYVDAGTHAKALSSSRLEPSIKDKSMPESFMAVIIE